jgi:hypothetical protein
MASQAIAKLAQAADGAKARLANYIARDRLTESRMLSFGEVIGGGAIAGLADGKFDDGTGGAHLFGVPAVPVAGVVAVLLGLSDAFKGSTHLGFLGCGALAYKVGDFAKEKIKAA